MGAHKNRYPDLEKLEPEYLADLLRRSNLSVDDRQIATSVVQWQMTYEDIGAGLGEIDDDNPRTLVGSTVRKRMKNIIAPRLRELMNADATRKQRKAGA
ncbi:MAG: hypothetical protein J6M10_10310 [Clostridia bacterium]|nr:hypothetical protein [Clostridia bacterium]